MRLRTSVVTTVSAALLTTGVLATGVVTAPPLSADESMAVKLHKLRVCESGNHYGENTHNGYYGAYQFAAGTWHSLGFHGRPDQAKAKTQNAAARKLHASQGWHPWPACAQRENL